MHLIKRRNKVSTEEINTVKRNLTKCNDQENELKRLKENNQELQNVYELEVKSYIIRSKGEYIEGGE